MQRKQLCTFNAFCGKMTFLTSFMNLLQELNLRIIPLLHLAYGSDMPKRGFISSTQELG
jgi:hypothetical protein